MTKTAELNPTPASVSALLTRVGFGKSTGVLRGRATLSGFKVIKGTFGTPVHITWQPGSSWDVLDSDTWVARVRAESDYMLPLYAQALRDRGYTVRLSDTGHSLLVQS